MPYASHPRYFPKKTVAAAVDGWFNAMAALSRTLPREAGPSSGYPLFVTLGSFDIESALLHPIKPGSGRRGFALLTGPDDHEAWLAMEAADQETAHALQFPRLELTFGSLSEAHPDVRQELEQRERDLGDAVPSVWAIDHSGESSPGNVNDLALFEAIAAAVAAVLEASPEGGGSLVAQTKNKPVVRTVKAGGEDTEVELSSQPLNPQAALPPAALLDTLRALDEENDPWLVDRQERIRLEHRLGRRFARSPEAACLTGTTDDWQSVAYWAVAYTGQSIASLGATDLDDVVFDIVPRKQSTEVDYTRPFIDSLRAFYRWLDREYRLPQAQTCLEKLNAPGAIEQFRSRIGDDAKLDPAKAMVIEARSMGVDPSTSEGQERMLTLWKKRQSMSDYDSFNGSPRTAGPLDAAAKRKRDAKRKAARKARKKNR